MEVRERAHEKQTQTYFRADGARAEQVKGKR